MSEDESISQEDIDRIYRFKERHGKKVISICMILLVLIVVFLGFAYGAARVCDQVDGFLDDRFTCHLGYNPDPSPSTGLPLVIGTVNYSLQT